MLQTISIIVGGKVQGVYYRQNTKEKAMELNITGFVKNLPNGDVYILATGTTDQVNALIEWCWKGSKRAFVTNVNYEVQPFQPFDSFKIEK
jgi:acylphosphatase